MSDSVLITGAGMGLGLATAVHLARQGFRVYASVQYAEHRSAVEAAAAEHGVSLRALQLDVTDRASIDAAVETIVAESGGIYGLVNNAGIDVRGFFEDVSAEEIRRVFDVNVFGLMAVTQAVLPHMRQARRGRIVMISSATGRIAEMTIGVYSSSKFAVEGLGEALAQEMMPFGIQVSLIEPGFVATPIFGANRGQAKKALDPSGPYYHWFAAHEKMTDELVAKKWVTPADVAHAVHRALTDRRPRLRYVVGTRARLILSLRRHSPGELFERIYFRIVARRLARVGVPSGVAKGQA